MNLLAFFDQRKQISALRQELDETKAEFRKIQDEWDDWFDRFRRLHARIARRQQRDESGNGVREDATEGAEMPTGGTPDGFSASQIAAQTAILRRRNRLLAGKVGA